jgi:thymidylate synthase (FAD)
MSTQSIQDHVSGLNSTPTYRPVSEGLEKHMFKHYKMLDHGSIIVLDYMGDEQSILEAARTSYGAGTRKITNDVGLLRYLMRMGHTTPYEMLEIKFLVKMPIFVARQWIRHRTANVNEKSARYSILEKEFYLPSPEVLAVQSITNKQGRGDTVPLKYASYLIQLLREDAEHNYETYEHLLNETIDEHGKAHIIAPKNSFGIARELARMNLTLNYYTTMVWKIDLHNLFHFLGLRADSHAQYEIRVYAEKICDIIQDWVPNAYKAFIDYRLCGAVISQQEIYVIRTIAKALETLRPGAINALEYGPHASKREIDAFKKLIGIEG